MRESEAKTNSIKLEFYTITVEFPYRRVSENFPLEKRYIEITVCIQSAKIIAWLFSPNRHKGDTIPNLTRSGASQSNDYHIHTSYDIQVLTMLEIGISDISFNKLQFISLVTNIPSFSIFLKWLSGNHAKYIISPLISINGAFFATLSGQKYLFESVCHLLLNLQSSLRCSFLK